MLEPVKLSLATFQPDKCYPPYLNTPRSLEACRMNGVNPLELVEIPFSEFQKDFPNDVDAARRRFERIDGARRRILTQVLADWKQLCDSGWKPEKKRPKSAKESILEVSSEAHCTLLEIQAAKFRKMERDNLEELQRHLKLEIMRADQEVQNKKIIGKHQEIQEKNDEYQNQRRLYLQELYRQELLRRKEEEEEEMKEIKVEQRQFQKYAIQRSHEQKEQMKREKALREQREHERVQRELYTKQVKDSILQSIENKVDTRKKMSEIRAKNNEDRLKEFFGRKERERDEKLRDLDGKIDHVKAEKERIAAEQRKAVLDKIMEHERHRKQVEEARERLKRESAPQKENEAHEKLNSIKEKKEGITRDKSERTLSALQMKDDLAKRELEKIREAQERRRAIKQIRQEAHEIALLRAQKAEEYRMQKVKEQIKNKEDRMNAIKTGFQVLDHMRNSMKDIMVKTNLSLKDEMHRLRHKDDFSPDKVAIKAMEVGSHTLFPSLQKKFGIETRGDDPMKKLYATTGGMNTNDSGDNFGFNLGSAPLMPIDTNPLYEGDRTVLVDNSQTGRPKSGSRGGSQTRGKTAGHGGGSGSPQRGDVATMQINQLTQDNLKSSLLESIKKVESLRQLHSTTTNKAQAASRAKRRDGDDDHDPRYPAPILKLRNEDGTWEDDGSSLSEKHSKTSSLTKGTGFIPGQTADNNDGRGRSRNSERKNRNKRSEDHDVDSEAESLSPKKNTDGDGNDIPIFEFTAGQEFSSKEQGSKSSPKKSRGGGGGDSHSHSRSRSGSRRRRGRRDPASTTSNDKSHRISLQQLQKKKEDLRTDVNDKAKFLKVPPGKFRREFSLDHPLAPNGKGKYQKELEKGLKPTGLFINPIKRKDEDIEETIKLSEKMEKLTYEAQTSILDANKDKMNNQTTNEFIENLKKDLNKSLEELIEEEQHAEEQRMEALKNVNDPQERYNMELIFAEERQRASDRIIAQTKENDVTLKKELLKTMNLGKIYD